MDYLNLSEGESGALSLLLPVIAEHPNRLVRFTKKSIPDLFGREKYRFISRLRELEDSGVIEIQTIDNETELIVKLCKEHHKLISEHMESSPTLKPSTQKE